MEARQDCRETVSRAMSRASPPASPRPASGAADEPARELRVLASVLERIGVDLDRPSAVFDEAGYSQFRRVAETPFNIVYEARV